MDFLSALKELKEGRCKGIKDYQGTIYKLSKIHNFFLEKEDQSFFSVCNIEFFLSPDWQLVNPKPQIELIEVVRQAIICEDGVVRSVFETDKVITPAKGQQVIILKGVMQREVKSKVKRREEIKSHIILTPSIPKNAKIYAEWTE